MGRYTIGKAATAAYGITALVVFLCVVALAGTALAA